ERAFGADVRTEDVTLRDFGSVLVYVEFVVGAARIDRWPAGAPEEVAELVHGDFFFGEAGGEGGGDAGFRRRVHGAGRGEGWPGRFPCRARHRAGSGRAACVRRGDVHDDRVAQLGFGQFVGRAGRP